jgi:hypothetical protein
MTIKKLKLLLIICMSSLLMTSSFAKDEKTKKTTPISNDELQAKAVMNQVYESFMKIVPYIYSENLMFEGKDKKVEDEIIKNLLDLQTAFKNARHLNLLKIPGFKPSLETINTHIQDTIDSLNTKNKVFAHARLKAMTSLCISCHSGLSEKISSNAFSEALVNVKRDKFESDYAYANYLYLVRRFTEAKTYYEFAITKALAKAQANSKTYLTDDKVVNGEIYSSLRRVVSIYTKISLKPESAITFLKKYQSDKAVSKITRGDIDLWIKSLEKWKKFDINNVKNIDEFITTNLSPLESSKDKVNSGEHDMTLLISAGVLTKYLADHPVTDLTPTILYWLAVSERRLSTTYFFSLSDLYLKECITQFSKNPAAKKCYQEYEDNVIFGFSGSSGTDIPQEERKELERLKSYLK